MRFIYISFISTFTMLIIISIIYILYRTLADREYNIERISYIDPQHIAVAPDINREQVKYKQKELLRLLKQWDSLCERHNIKYVAISGTLLGALRHRGFIPWDDDIDVAVDANDWKKIDRIYKHINDIEVAKPIVPWYQLKRIYFKDKPNIFIDIFKLHRYFDKYTIFNIPLCMANMHKVFPSKRLPFEEIYINIPNDINVLSEMCLITGFSDKDLSKLPSIKNRKPSHDGVKSIPFIIQQFI